MATRLELHDLSLKSSRIVHMKIVLMLGIQSSRKCPEDSLQISHLSIGTVLHQLQDGRKSLSALFVGSPRSSTPTKLPWNSSTGSRPALDIRHKYGTEGLGKIKTIQGWERPRGDREEGTTYSKLNVRSPRMLAFNSTSMSKFASNRNRSPSASSNPPFFASFGSI